MFEKVCDDCEAVSKRNTWKSLGIISVVGIMAILVVTTIALVQTQMSVEKLRKENINTQHSVEALRQEIR